MPQDAVLLMGVIAGLYLYDSTLLLHANEGVLQPGRGGRWSVSLGARHFRLQGKPLYIPNPLFPHRPMFRLSWRLEGAGAPTPQGWDARARALRPLGLMVWGVAIALFALLPLGFFSALGDRVLLGALVLLYGVLSNALAWIWRRRAEFDLSRSQFAALAFECVVCSPLALNLVRRLSLRIGADEDLVGAARRLQRPEDWQATRAQLSMRLDEAIETEEEGSPRMASLVAHRRALSGD